MRSATDRLAAARRFALALALATIAWPAAAAADSLVIRARLAGAKGPLAAGRFVDVVAYDGDRAFLFMTETTGAGGLITCVLYGRATSLLLFDEREGSARVPVPAGTGDEPIDLGAVRLERRWFVRGRVLRAGRPVPATVGASCGECPGGPGPADVATAEDGSFELLLPMPGPWTLEAYLHRREPSGCPARNGSWSAPSDVSRKVEVPEGPPPVVLRADLVVPTGVVEGTVRDPAGKPVAGALVVVQSGPASRRTAWSLPDGSFHVDSVPPGSRRVDVFHRGHAAVVRENVRVPEKGAARLDVVLPGAAPFLVADDRDDGRPIPPTIFDLYEMDDGLRRLTPPRDPWMEPWPGDGHGRRLVDFLGPGRYLLVYYRHEGLGLAAVELPVPAGRIVVLPRPETRAIRIAVRDETGAPVRGARMTSLVPEGGPDILLSAWRTVGLRCCDLVFDEDEDAGTIVPPPLPVGCWRATIEAGGREVTVPFCLGLEGAPEGPLVEVRDACRRPVTVRELEVVPGRVPTPLPDSGERPSPIVRVVPVDEVPPPLPPGRVAIEGRVLDAGGAPVAGALVVAHPPGPVRTRDLPWIRSGPLEVRLHPAVAFLAPADWWFRGPGREFLPAGRRLPPDATDPGTVVYGSPRGPLRLVDFLPAGTWTAIPWRPRREGTARPPFRFRLPLPSGIVLRPEDAPKDPAPGSR